MYKNRSFNLAAVYILMILMILLLLFSSFGYVTNQSFVDTVHPLKTATASVNGGPNQTITLPHTFQNLDPCTPVTISKTVQTSASDSFSLKTVSSPAKVYLDDKPAYEFGLRDNYPDFMLDPGTEVHVVGIPENTGSVTLKMVYSSPSNQDSLTVYPPILGDDKLLIFNQFHNNLLPLVLATMQILGGLALLFVSVCIAVLDKKGLLFFWMGLFSFTSGVWAFGENYFTSMALKNPTVIYLVTYFGFFTFIIPLLHFTRTMIDFEHPNVLRNLEFFFVICAVVFFALQFFGILACSASALFYNVVLSPALIFLTWITAREGFSNNNIIAKYFSPPLAILASFSVLELINHSFSNQCPDSMVFQIGVVFFLLFMGFFVGIVIKDSITLTNKNKELAFQESILGIQIEEQKERGLMLARKEQLLRQQRHDLRHQITVIRALANPDNQPLQDYLNELIEQIPKSEERFCENTIVNSIISHYVSICKNTKIDLSLHLVVPPAKEHMNDSELCVIFGNLLENAVEACERITDGNRFIILKSSLQYDLLTITMDNSFNGELFPEGNRYHSSKRDDYGIGLESIRSVAKKAGGDVEFQSEGNIFHSSVYVQL